MGIGKGPGTRKEAKKEPKEAEMERKEPKVAPKWELAAQGS
jgi:hypothetical protein